MSHPNDEEIEKQEAAEALGKAEEPEAEAEEKAAEAKAE
jgi:hypothetical protein